MPNWRELLLFMIIPLCLEELTDNGYLTLEKQLGSYVPVAIFEITKEEERFLDKYEGYPSLYYKIHLSITIKGKGVMAMVYIMNKGYNYCLPDVSYVEICSKG